MEPHARYTLVGIVTLGLAAFTAFALVWLEGGPGEGIKPFSIYFERHSLRGLQPDGEVTMRGIPVGRIRSLEISEDVERVRVTVELKSATPVKTDTRAVIERNLLTGLASIDLIDTSRDSPPLVQIPPGAEHPVIPEGPAEIESIRKSLPEVLSGAQTLIDRLAELFSDENRAKVANILSSTEELTRELTAKKDGVDRLLNDMHLLVADVRRLTETIDETMKKVSDKPLEEGNLLLADVRKLAATLDAAVREVLVTHSNNLARLTEDVSRAAAALSKTLEDFENPRTLLSGPAEWALGPGEAKKR